MSPNDVNVVLVHGAWADGSSWAKLIARLAADGIKVVAALNRALERTSGPRPHGVGVVLSKADQQGRQSRDPMTLKM